MNTLNRLASSILALFLFLIVSTKVAVAASLQWTLSYPTSDLSTTIKFAPSDSASVFASIKKSDGNYDLLKSIDHGITWQSKKNNLPSGADINWLSIQNSNKNIIAVSLWGSGINLSEDGGDSWNNILSAPFPRAVEIDPANINRIYAGISDNAPGLYLTNNKGAPWTLTGPGGGNSVMVIVDPNNASRIFTNIGGTFYRSIDHGNSWSPLTVPTVEFINGRIDSVNPQTLYIVATNGFYKSTNNGDSWQQKSVSSGSQLIHKVTQDANQYLYVSIRGNPGGVWKSTNGGDNWENVSDPSWGTASVWGLDTGGGRIVAGVEGMGVYVANTDGSPIGGTPPPEIHPTVFIPGFGGSWSYKGLFLNQPTTYNDWTLTPKFTDSYYQPFLNATGATVFAYDYRKSVVDNANSLNQFLGDKFPGQKTNIAAHSMGGMVVRYCFQKISGCSNKINKIVTGGTPHQGSLDAYDFWEGDQINETDLMIKFAEDLVLHLSGLPQIRGIDIIHNNIPGAKDLLPIFNYINGKPYSSLSSWGKNPVLESLNPMPGNFSSILTALSGTGHQTNRSFDVTAPNILERLTNTWIDGRPTRSYQSDGDGAVLKLSSEVLTATNKYYPVWHSEYFGNQTVINDVKNIFGLPTLMTMSLRTAAPTPPTSLSQIGIIYTLDDAVLTVTDQSGNPVGTSVDGGRVIFIDGPKKKYKITIQSNQEQKVRVHQLFDQIGKPSFERDHDEKCRRGERRKFDWD